MVRTLLLLLAAHVAVACGSSGSDDGPPPETGEALTTYVGFERRFTLFNGDPAIVGSLARGDKNFATGSFSVIAEADEGLELDYFGNAFQASDTPALMATIRILGRVRDRSQAAQSAVFSFDRDRDIGFKPDPFNPLLMDETTMVEPKSVALAHVGGFVIVADAGDTEVKVWGSAAAGNVPPLFASAVPAPAWDVAYDEPNDRLFAALTDGTIAVFDAFVATRPAAQSRIIEPSTDGTAQTTTSLRGILHSTASGADRLIFTDIGVEGSGGGLDGSVLQIVDASTAAGVTDARVLISGSASLLADPSDVVLTPDGRLRVADLTGDRVSIFNPTTPGPGAQPPYVQAPALVQARQNPSGIAVEPLEAERLAGVSDVDDATAVTVDGIVVSTRPGAGNGLLLRLAADLQSAPTAFFDVGQPIAGATLDVAGDAFVAYAPGVAVVNRFASQRGTGGDVTFDESRDRTVENVVGPFDPPMPMVDPRVVEIDDLEDLLIIADVGLPGIWVYGRNAGPTARTERILRQGFAIGVNEPWGLDYDPASDTLYVAGSAGAIFVYENLTTNPGELPDRTITPSDAFGATQISTDLRGLVHDASRDTLVVGDVGSASGSSSDGSLFVIEGASTASGLTPVAAAVAGATTRLDDPLDLAWDGATLWVAESGGGEILRFDDFLTLSGDVAPTAFTALPDVVSVEINPDFLSPATGGSIHVD